MQYIDLAEKLLSIDSSPDVGTTYVCDYLIEVAHKLGLNTKKEVFHIEGVDQSLLMVSSKSNSCDSSVVYWSNLQTNDPGTYSYWKETDLNPYRLTIKDEKVYGLGSASGKLDFLMRMIALSNVPKDENIETPILVGGFGGMRTKEGAKAFLSTYKSNLHLVVNSEPTNLQAYDNYSGSVVVKISIPFTEEERLTRKAYFEKEVTSTQTKIFHDMPGFAFQSSKTNEVITSMKSYLDKIPSNITLINLEVGVSPYLVPSEGFLELDIGAASSGDSIKDRLSGTFASIERVFKDRFSRYIKKYDLDNFPEYNLGFIRTTDEGIEIEGCFFLTHGVDKNRVRDWIKLIESQDCSVSLEKFHSAYRTPLEVNELKETSLDMMKPRKNHMQHLPSDTAFFLGKGVPAVGFGSGEGAGYAVVNEYNLKSDLDRSIEVYKKLFSKGRI